MSDLLDQMYANALLAAKELSQVLQEKKDIGTEKLKLCLYAQVNYQRTLGSLTQEKAVNLKCIKYLAGKDLKEQKRLVKEQNLLPDKK